jgi:2'-5' RNA ligase
VAVDISPEVRSATLRLIERLRAAQTKVTWTKPDNLHYTLKFLGDVPAEQTPGICRAVREAVAPFTPFEVVAGHVGAFPAVSHPRTLWLGVSENVEPFELLFQAVERLLEPLGFPREHRRFTPHLTLGRVRENDPAALDPLTGQLKKHSSFDAGPLAIASVTVYCSTFGREGPSYEVLSRAEFEN